MNNHKNINYKSQIHVYNAFLQPISGYVNDFCFDFQMQSGAETYPMYGAGPGSWSAYDIQRAQGHR